jgi:hypothetical protein
MFFKEFPVVPYPFYLGDNRQYAIARNLLRRVAFSNRINEEVAFTLYDIKDGERPEHIANRLYGNANYHWIILLANDIVDPYYGWYMSQSVLEQYIQKRYSGIALYFTDSSGNFVYDTEFASGCTLEQNGISQPIKFHRDTFCEFVVESPVFGIGSAIVHKPSGSTAGIYIQKTLPYYQGVNYFRLERPTGDAEGASGAQEYPVVDPISKQTADYEEYAAVLGNKYPPVGIGGATGATVEFWETYIGKYMGVSGDEINLYSVSNYTYEHDKNEKKRTIRVLNPAFLKQAMKELKAAMGV